MESLYSAIWFLYRSLHAIFNVFSLFIVCLVITCMFDSYTPDLNLFCFRTLYGMNLTIECTLFPYLTSLHHLFLSTISSILYSKNMLQDPYLLSYYIPLFPQNFILGLWLVRYLLYLDGRPYVRELWPNRLILLVFHLYGNFYH